ncbi:hypothetical protein [Bartonella queenslandensis]|uniref:hypothetical protein n=1 Tax=Bartonella queenslandensis TaxID=481138 RepID=UPI000302D8DC|nr:hypothetical protein [Bartonella queenslandensis]
MSGKRIDELCELCESLHDCLKLAVLDTDLSSDIRKVMNNVVIKMRGVIHEDSPVDDLTKLIFVDTNYGNGELILHFYPILERLNLEKSLQLKKCA